MENLVKNYLDKNYYVKEYRFFNRFGDIHEWGFEIAKLISGVFSYTLEDSKTELTKWAYEHDTFDENFHNAYGKKELKVRWSREMAMDLHTMYGIDSAEEQIVALVSEELCKEIDAEILRTMRDEIKTSEDLLGVVKCLGYETTETTYNENTFAPEKRFISNYYNEMIREREHNSIWRKYVRNTEA